MPVSILMRQIFPFPLLQKNVDFLQLSTLTGYLKRLWNILQRKSGRWKRKVQNRFIEPLTVVRLFSIIFGNSRAIFCAQTTDYDIHIQRLFVDVIKGDFNNDITPKWMVCKALLCYRNKKGI